MAEGPVGRVGWDALWLPATVGPAWVGTPPPSTLVTRPAASGYRWVGGHMQAVQIPACAEMGRHG